MGFCCSEEEAKKKIYSVCTTTYTGFGALISEELSYKVKGLCIVVLVIHVGGFRVLGLFLSISNLGCFIILWIKFTIFGGFRVWGFSISLYFECLLNIFVFFPLSIDLIMLGAQRFMLWSSYASYVSFNMAAWWNSLWLVLFSIKRSGFCGLLVLVSLLFCGCKLGVTVAEEWSIVYLKFWIF